MNTPPPDPCIITMLRSPARLEPHTCNEAANEIERLRKERDEARRNLCFTEAANLSFGPDGVPYHPSVAHKIAEDYGWDCFNEKEEADANNDEFRKNYR